MDWLPKLTKKGYSCLPSIDEMKNIGEHGLKSLRNFMVENEYCLMTWLEPVDVTNQNLDEVL